MFSNGDTYNVSTAAIDSVLANSVSDWESRGVPAQTITAGIKDYFNSYNPVQSNTDSHARTE